MVSDPFHQLKSLRLGPFFLCIPFVSVSPFTGLVSLFYFEVFAQGVFTSRYPTDCSLKFIDSISTSYSILFIYLLSLDLFQSIYYVLVLLL